MRGWDSDIWICSLRNKGMMMSDKERDSVEYATPEDRMKAMGRAAPAPAAAQAKIPTTIVVQSAGETIWAGVRHHTPGETVYIDMRAAPIADQEQARGMVGLTDEAIDDLMEKIQEFASTWAVVGGRFDDGTAMERAEESKAEIRAILRAAPPCALSEIGETK